MANELLKASPKPSKAITFKLSHAPILQSNIILFDFIPRHYVKFYAKVVIDDSTESRMLNVIMNILIMNILIINK